MPGMRDAARDGWYSCVAGIETWTGSETGSLSLSSVSATSGERAFFGTGTETGNGETWSYTLLRLRCSITADHNTKKRAHPARTRERHLVLKGRCKLLGLGETFTFYLVFVITTDTIKPNRIRTMRKTIFCFVRHDTSYFMAWYQRLARIHGYAKGNLTDVVFVLYLSLRRKFYGKGCR